MPTSAAVSKQLSIFLRNHLKKSSFTGVDEWKLEYSLDRHRRVDVAGIGGGKPKILIEIERRREDPASNVAKVWFWASSTKNRPRITLVQAFSKAFDEGKPKSERKKAAEFLARQMRKEFPTIKYWSAEFEVNPKVGARVLGGRSNAGAGKLADWIRERWQETHG